MVKKRTLNFHLIFLVFISPLIFVSFCNAQDDRIEAELKDTSPFVNPLKSALGDVAYEKAIKSGEYTYSGNLKCRLCHRDFFMGRKKDLHEHTFKKSVKKHRKETRCFPCHATGYGIDSGFTSLKETPKLANVQCEGCHGPGRKHNELGAKGGFLAGTDKPDTIKKMCQACHNSRWNKSYKDLDTAYKAYKDAEAAAIAPSPGK